MRVAIYSRVSTSHQSFQRQTSDLKRFSAQYNYEVVGVYEEIVSGYKKNCERPMLTKLIEDVKLKNIDKVLVTEISRLGRSVKEVSETIQFFNKKHISLHITMNGLETLVNGELNPMTSFMINILTSVAEMEKSITIERMKSGRENFIANGGYVGRPKNTALSDEEYLSKHTDVLKYLKKNYSIRNIAKLTNKGISTVQRVKKTKETTSIKL